VNQPRTEMAGTTLKLRTMTRIRIRIKPMDDSLVPPAPVHPTIRYDCFTLTISHFFHSTWLDPSCFGSLATSTKQVFPKLLQPKKNFNRFTLEYVPGIRPIRFFWRGHITQHQKCPQKTTSNTPILTNLTFPSIF